MSTAPPSWSAPTCAGASLCRCEYLARDGDTQRHNGTVRGNINAGGGVSTVNLSGGTLIVSNNVGSATAPLTALNLTGASLRLKADGNAPHHIIATTITTSGTPRSRSTPCRTSQFAQPPHLHRAYPLQVVTSAHYRPASAASDNAAGLIDGASLSRRRRHPYIAVNGVHRRHK